MEEIVVVESWSVEIFEEIYEEVMEESYCLLVFLVEDILVEEVGIDIFLFEYIVGESL